jgi:hypothetical protein
MEEVYVVLIDGGDHFVAKTAEAIKSHFFDESRGRCRDWIWDGEKFHIEWIDDCGKLIEAVAYKERVIK